jgi:outer membrane protein assembly factor BamB
VKHLILFGMTVTLVAGAARGDDWPQWMGTDRDAVWHETGILQKFPPKGPTVLWRTPIKSGFSGPAVAGGKVYVMDYATDVDFRKQSNPGTRPKIKGSERVLCLDARSGKEIWKHEYDCPYKISYPAGPRCTPTVQDGKVYTLGAEGNLFCLDADTGKPIWSKEFKKDYKSETPIWGVCGHPLVDGKKLICTVGGPGALAVAFDKDTGKEIWKSLSAKEPGYSAPTIIEAGGKRQLLIWDAEVLNSLDPETGKPYWAVDIAPQHAMSIMAPRKTGDHLFAGGIGNKSVMLKLAADKPAVTEVWRGDTKTGVGPINMTPFVDGGYMYAVDQPGDLIAIDVKTGKRLWATSEPVTGKKKKPTGTAFIVKNGDRYFLFNELGELVIAKLSPEKFEEIDRAKILEPTGVSFNNNDVVWSHPAFANKCMFARNDKEIVCVSLAAE